MIGMNFDIDGPTGIPAPAACRARLREPVVRRRQTAVST